MLKGTETIQWMGSDSAEQCNRLCTAPLYSEVATAKQNTVLIGLHSLKIMHPCGFLVLPSWLPPKPAGGQALECMCESEPEVTSMFVSFESMIRCFGDMREFRDSNCPCSAAMNSELKCIVVYAQPCTPSNATIPPTLNMNYILVLAMQLHGNVSLSSAFT